MNKEELITAIVRYTHSYPDEPIIVIAPTWSYRHGERGRIIKTISIAMTTDDQFRCDILMALAETNIT